MEIIKQIDDQIAKINLAMENSRERFTILVGEITELRSDQLLHGKDVKKEIASKMDERNQQQEIIDNGVIIRQQLQDQRASELEKIADDEMKERISEYMKLADDRYKLNADVEQIAKSILKKFDELKKVDRLQRDIARKTNIKLPNHTVDRNLNNYFSWILGHIIETPISSTRGRGLNEIDSMAIHDEAQS